MWERPLRSPLARSASAHARRCSGSTGSTTRAGGGARLTPPRDTSRGRRWGRRRAGRCSTAAVFDDADRARRTVVPGRPRDARAVAGGSGGVLGVALDDARVYWVTARPERVGAQRPQRRRRHDDHRGTVSRSRSTSPSSGRACTGPWPPGAGPQCMAMVASTPGSAPDGERGAELRHLVARRTVRMAPGGRASCCSRRGPAPRRTTSTSASRRRAPFTNVRPRAVEGRCGDGAGGFLGNKNGYHVDEVALPGTDGTPSSA